jgi:hypothetical protein
MFAETEAKNRNLEITFIPPEIQSNVIREEADRFLFDDIEKLELGGDEKAPPKDDIKKLTNLIHGLGGLFRQILLSDRSERRVFSIAFSDAPSGEVNKILELGVLLGYFHKSTLGRKDSKSGGRTRLFVLSRRLSPIWNLDPTGFAGYLFVTNRIIEEAMNNPNSMLRRIQGKIFDEEVGPIQPTLFEGI